MVMACLSFIRSSIVLLAVAINVTAQTLNPIQDILLPESGSAKAPLKWLGANSPCFAGPNVHGISSDIPEGCKVDQAAYVVRHGSKYPDQGAYNGWVALYQKHSFKQPIIQLLAPLSFLPTWKPVLKEPSVQISQESTTGYKESYDLGYSLRTRYPDLYTEGTPFKAWANLYPRVVQTARMFVRGFLGPNSDILGTVITVNSTGSPEALGNSLSPSDLCPAFVDGNGGTYATTWDSVYLPPITARLNKLLSGNLTLTDSDVSNFPYLCEFESQITGQLSPWCGFFNDEELKDYEYRQDLRYYYGTGPGTVIPSTMMLPFLNSLVDLLVQGPGVTGTSANGSTYPLPGLIMAFANDGQINELPKAVGVFDNETPFSGTERPKEWTFISSHFVSMRGTVAFERLNCVVSSSPSKTTSTNTASASPVKPAVCNQDNCLRQFLHSPAVTPFCATYTAAKNLATTDLPSYVSQCAGSPSRISSACNCVTTPSTTSAIGAGTTSPSSSLTNQSYIRIRFNEAVYPVNACRHEPGRSCLASKYASLIASKYNATGNWHDNCNVTNPVSPKVVKGATFFTNLGLSWLQTVVP